MSILLCQGTATALPLRDASVHCVVTSPPYWGLRDYGTATWEGGEASCAHKKGLARHDGMRSQKDGFHGSASPDSSKGDIYYPNHCPACGAIRVDAQLGLEKMHDCNGAFTGQSCGECYICHMRAVLKEVWRVLRDDGTLWLNIGDSYAGSSMTGGKGKETLAGGRRWQHETMFRRTRRTTGLRPKNLCGIPWRLALALQQDAWTLRSEIIWDKVNPMPESVQDRPTKSHEQVFLLTKGEHYFFDADAIKETVDLPNALRHNPNGRQQNSTPKNTIPGQGIKSNSSFNAAVTAVVPFRNSRTVWRIPSQGFHGAHYACFPPELARRCILAGTSAHGCCAACGSPWRMEVERAVYGKVEYAGKYSTQDCNSASRNMNASQHAARLAGGPHNNPFPSPKALGWFPTCACAAPIRPCTVFDPFCGSGTTLLGARELGRHGIGTDLSLPYLRDIARDRLGLADLAAWEGRSTGAAPMTYDDLPLFTGATP